MLYIGIDPGEAWCGFAALEIALETQFVSVRAEARTYSVKHRGGYLAMANDLFQLLPHQRPTILIAEDFQIRHSGHQRFNHGDTLRFLGALEFGATFVKQFNFALIPPNDRAKQETRDLFGPGIRSYARKWPKPGHAAWHHCLSAWRVIGQYLLINQCDVLQRMHKLTHVRRCDRWIPVSMGDVNKHEHIAPAARWME